MSSDVCRFGLWKVGREDDFHTSLDAYKAATRPKMARRPAPVAERAAAAPSKGGAVADSVGAPVPEGAGASMGTVPLADG